jgi:hypothetical protein
MDTWLYPLEPGPFFIGIPQEIMGYEIVPVYLS